MALTAAVRWASLGQPVGATLKPSAARASPAAPAAAANAIAVATFALSDLLDISSSVVFSDGVGAYSSDVLSRRAVNGFGERVTGPDLVATGFAGAAVTDGATVSGAPAACCVKTVPKLRSRIWKSIKSTFASALTSPWDSVAPAAPKLA